uniref:EF-hand domain-containing protein n=1 Tax=Chromera velia CCMP2878 TaxID=1169474 RepID=A0A0G4HJY9_9ALVE|eukprot:Cvel_7212.t1-p1 / transcript=Cvel_7212.t1 / gene=Cvel_7212 / organism=Chromera_velia_CCMP2878 / gene_product=hypothetical protein / transcript_product=hypothetical protein / location=Cvel_scaffold371:65800-74212(+) / protein_length=2155 / sequence_SO=supercontig / SO=protein_coding / is_pseudo=false
MGCGASRKASIPAAQTDEIRPALPGKQPTSSAVVNEDVKDQGAAVASEGPDKQGAQKEGVDPSSAKPPVSASRGDSKQSGSKEPAQADDSTTEETCGGLTREASSDDFRWDHAGLRDWIDSNQIVLLRAGALSAPPSAKTVFRHATDFPESVRFVGSVPVGASIFAVITDPTSEITQDLLKAVAHVRRTAADEDDFIFWSQLSMPQNETAKKFAEKEAFRMFTCSAVKTAVVWPNKKVRPDETPAVFSHGPSMALLILASFCQRIVNYDHEAVQKALHPSRLTDLPGLLAACHWQGPDERRYWEETLLSLIPRLRPISFDRKGFVMANSQGQIAWLKVSFVRKLASLNSPFPRRQELPEGTYFVGVPPENRFVVSHCWASEGHPSPSGTKMRLLWEELQKVGAHDDDGVFLDFCSLPQKARDVPAEYLRALDPKTCDSFGPVKEGKVQLVERTRQEIRRFHAALWEMSRLYSYMDCKVIVLPLLEDSSEFPGGGEAWGRVSTTPYVQRGWCITEFSMARLLGRIVNLESESVQELLRLREWPQSVDEYSKLLHSNDVKFTNKADLAPVLLNFYRVCFGPSHSLTPELQWEESLHFNVKIGTAEIRRVASIIGRDTLPAQSYCHIVLHNALLASEAEGEGNTRAGPREFSPLEILQATVMLEEEEWKLRREAPICFSNGIKTPLLDELRRGAVHTLVWCCRGTGHELVVPGESEELSLEPLISELRSLEEGKRPSVVVLCSEFGPQRMAERVFNEGKVPVVLWLKAPVLDVRHTRNVILGVAMPALTVVHRRVMSPQQTEAVMQELASPLSLFWRRDGIKRIGCLRSTKTPPGWTPESLGGKGVGPRGKESLPWLFTLSPRRGSLPSQTSPRSLGRSPSDSGWRGRALPLRAFVERRHERTDVWVPCDVTQELGGTTIMERWGEVFGEGVSLVAAYAEVWELQGRSVPAVQLILSVGGVAALQRMRDLTVEVTEGMLTGTLEASLAAALDREGGDGDRGLTVKLNQEKKEGEGGGEKSPTFRVSVDKTTAAEDYASLVLEVDRLTEHQQEALSRCGAAQRVHFQAPAGGGKTFVALTRLLVFMRENPDTFSLLVVKNRPLAIFIGVWMASRVPYPVEFRDLLSRFRVLHEPFESGMKGLGLEKDVLVMVDDPPALKKSQPFDLIMVDEAHHIYAHSQLRRVIEPYVIASRSAMLLSDISQTSNPGLTFTAGFEIVRLTEVVRNSNRIVAGSLPFRIQEPGVETPEISCHHESVGPPLKSFIFRVEKPELRWQLYTSHTLRAVAQVIHDFPYLSLHNRMALLVPTEQFRDEFKPHLEFAFQQNPFSTDRRLEVVDACRGSALVSRGSLSRTGTEWVVLDAISNFDGLERLIVICVGLDAPISDENTEAAKEARSRLYRGITRAQMMVVVVNELEVGGWLEFLATTTFDKERDFDLAAEQQRLNTDDATRIVEHTEDDPGGLFDSGHEIVYTPVVVVEPVTVSPESDAPKGDSRKERSGEASANPSRDTGPQVEERTIMVPTVVPKLTLPQEKEKESDRGSERPSSARSARSVAQTTWDTKGNVEGLEKETEGRDLKFDPMGFDALTKLNLVPGLPSVHGQAIHLFPLVPPAAALWSLEKREGGPAGLGLAPTYVPLPGSPTWTVVDRGALRISLQQVTRVPIGKYADLFRETAKEKYGSIEEAFKVFDLDMSENISLMELDIGLNRLGLDREVDHKALFQELDADKSGAFTLDQMKGAVETGFMEVVRSLGVRKQKEGEGEEEEPLKRGGDGISKAKGAVDGWVLANLSENEATGVGGWWRVEAVEGVGMEGGGSFFRLSNEASGLLLCPGEAEPSGVPVTLQKRTATSAESGLWQMERARENDEIMKLMEEDEPEKAGVEVIQLSDLVSSSVKGANLCVVVQKLLDRIAEIRMSFTLQGSGDVFLGLYRQGIPLAVELLGEPLTRLSEHQLQFPQEVESTFDSSTFICRLAREGDSLAVAYAGEVSLSHGELKITHARKEGGEEKEKKTKTKNKRGGGGEVEKEEEEEEEGPNVNLFGDGEGDDEDDETETLLRPVRQTAPQEEGARSFLTEPVSSKPKPGPGLGGARRQGPESGGGEETIELVETNRGPMREARDVLGAMIDEMGDLVSRETNHREKNPGGLGSMRKPIGTKRLG